MRHMRAVRVKGGREETGGEREKTEAWGTG